jgi:hypothetical protein
MHRYLIHRAGHLPELAGRWEGPAWGHAPVAAIESFHARSSDHRPRAEAKLLYDEQSIFALFRVGDAYVRCVHTDYESDTYKDSCVELFVQPSADSGYFALEINCGGAFSLRYIEDPTRTTTRFAKWTPISAANAASIRVAHSMPAIVEPEREEPTSWWVELAWPRAVLETHCGPLGRLAGQQWRGNVFKCGDETSHPHWASWAPIGEQLNFHQPSYFGALEFSPDPAA